ncbi:MAG TPA: response regulator transcription factor [Candidatus Acidoferrum sp.]|nr:response regulator transcription factor [Candidatus Acidoferrum sp.]
MKLQADGQSAEMIGSSFSAPLVEIFDFDQTVAPTHSAAFVGGETLKPRAVNLPAVRKKDAGLVGSARNPDPSDALMWGDVTISLSAMEVHRTGLLVALTLKEFKTLAYLLNNPRRVISRNELLNKVWGYQCYPCTRTVDNHILRLRKKLEREPARPEHFRTVHGIGYKFLP